MNDADIFILKLVTVTKPKLQNNTKNQQYRQHFINHKQTQNSKKESQKHTQIQKPKKKKTKNQKAKKQTQRW